jgi:large subunit ribosomal protein L22
MATTTPELQTVRAQAKWVRMSPRKGRVVAEHIRGRSVPEARAVLAFTQRAAAREIEKVLASAVANAEANHGLSGDDLVVHAAVVDEGPTMKRWRARARGRVARIKKRTCHVTIALAPPAQALEVAPPPKARTPEAVEPEVTEEAPEPKPAPKAAEKPAEKPKGPTTKSTTTTSSARAKRARNTEEN